MKNTSLSKILSVLLSLCVLLCMVPIAGVSVSALDAVLDDDGTTILISTAEQLAAIGVDENYPLNGSYKLTNDIDLSNWGNWTPIAPYAGNNVNTDADGLPYFTGTFDGNGHTISGMTVSVSANHAYAGLFGIIKNATVKNLVMRDVNVDSNGGVISRAGAVVASASKSTIENVAICGAVVNAKNSNYANSFSTGVILGWSATSAKVLNCYAEGDVTATYIGATGYSNQCYVGGILGGGWLAWKNATVTGCVFVGQLTNNYYTETSDGYEAYNFTNSVMGGSNQESGEIIINNTCYYIATANVNSENSKGTDGIAKTVEEFENTTRAKLGLSDEYWRDGAGMPALIVSLPKTNVNYPGYIPIYSAKQLAKIGKDDAYPLSGKYILMNDIEMSDYGTWTPIGKLNNTGLNIGWIGQSGRKEEYVTAVDKVFTGTLDGNGHTVSDMTVSYSTSRPFAGLFGIVHNASIQNIVFKNANVTSTGTQTSDAGIVAGAASNANTVIQNVSVCNSDVTANNSQAKDRTAVGGLVGYGAEGTTVKNCYVDANLTANFTLENSFSEQMYVSGFVGMSYNCLAKVYDSVFVGTLTNNYHNYSDGTEKNANYNFTAGVNMSMNENLKGVSSNVYYIDNAGVNTEETAKKALNGVAISADTLKTATAASMKFDGYYWKNDGEALYLAVAPVQTNADGAIEISTAEELAHIGVYSQYPRTGDYVLTADIDMSDYGNWTPLCYGVNSGNQWIIDKQKAFNGTFDGQGHTISGMTINSSIDNNMVGFFACVTSNSTKTTMIKNLVFKDCSVTATSNKYCDAGIVAGASDVDNNISVIFSNIAIIDCSVNATVTKENASSAASVVGNGTRAQLYDIYSNADISGGCTIENSKFGMAGMVGRAWRGYAWAECAIFNGTLKNQTPESEYTYANGIFAYNADHNNYPTDTSTCKNIYYNSDKLTVSTKTNGGEYNGTAFTNFDLGISPISVIGLSDKWMHNGTTPILKIVGDDAYVTGDATGDGRQDIRDLIRLKKYMANTMDEISLIAVDLKRDRKIDVNDMLYLRKALLGLNNAITLDLSTSAENVKYLGAVYTENGKLIMTRENTGYELSVMAEGDITTILTYVSTTGFPYAKLAVTVDGETEIIKVYDGIATYKLASNLDWGEHTIEVLKITEYTKGSIYAADISFNGALNVKPANAELAIDFYGDSITAGDGVVKNDRKTNEDFLEGQFSNKTYAAQTAALLGADMRAVAQSGLKTVNAVNTLSLTGSAKWGYNADVVVINLGTNDWSVISEGGSAATEAGQTAEVNAVNAVLNAVIECYPQNTKIVWCYGSMGDTYGYEEVIKNAVQAFAQSNENVSYCSLMQAANNDGGSGHPTEAGHADAAAILAAHINSILTAG